MNRHYRSSLRPRPHTPIQKLPHPSEFGTAVWENTPDDGNNDKESWIVSYIDVLTLLLTLFVLLLSFSNVSTSTTPNDNHALEDTTAVATLETNNNALAPTADSSSQRGLSVASPGIKDEMTGAPFNAQESRSQGNSLLPLTAQITLDEPTETDLVLKDLELEGFAIALRSVGFDKDVQFSLNKNMLNLQISNNLLFERGSAKLQSAGYEVLDELTAFLDTNNHTVSVEGHTDNVPISTRQYPSNWELSSARATNVTRYLIENGIDETRLRAIGYANTRPRDNNTSEEGRTNNRRVTIVVHLPKTSTSLAYRN